MLIEKTLPDANREVLVPLASELAWTCGLVSDRPPDPKSGASTSFATGAHVRAGGFPPPGKRMALLFPWWPGPQLQRKPDQARSAWQRRQDLDRDERQEAAESMSVSEM